MKKEKTQSLFLAQLRKLPIVQNACQMVDVSRTAVYNWRRDDPTFAKEMDEALRAGEAFLNDLSENQLVSLIQDKNFAAISFWLRHRHPEFRDKLEISGDVTHRVQRELTDEEKELRKAALRLGLPKSILREEKKKKE
jgi:hypothetical protein